MHDTNGPLIGLANEQTTTEPRVSKRSPDERSDIWIFLFPSAPVFRGACYRDRLSRFSPSLVIPKLVCSPDLPTGCLRFRCPDPVAKIFLFSLDPNHPYIRRRSVPKEGRIAIVTDAGRNAVDAGNAVDEQRCRGRRSRVVLTPRRRRQVGDDASHHADDGDKKARSPGRVRRKPLKPLRRKCRVFR
jgi:hypothetical protein